MLFCIMPLCCQDQNCTVVFQPVVVFVKLLVPATNRQPTVNVINHEVMRSEEGRFLPRYATTICYDED